MGPKNATGHARPPGRVRIWSVLGPGLLMAGAAIGVSHIVQSTRAGADFGLQLIPLILLVNLLKYPFFEIGHRYAAATGESLLHGYLKLGRGSLFLCACLNLFAAVVSIAGVTFVNAALAQSFIHSGLSLTAWSSLLLGTCLAIILVGRYPWLDRGMKVVMSILLLTTVAALIMALRAGPAAPPEFSGPSPFRLATLGFLIALMGWMPAPIELSVWQSLWVMEKNRGRASPLTLSEARIDFNCGYGLSTVTAVLFTALGAWVMFGTGVSFLNSGAGFARQFVDLYTLRLGEWTRGLVALAAFVTMFSTVLTVLDAYPRSLAVTGRLILGHPAQRARTIEHALWILVCGAAALLIIERFSQSLTGMVDLATTLAFLAAPVFAALNLRLILSRHTPQHAKPGRALVALAAFGLLYLSAFGLLYLWHRAW